MPKGTKNTATATTEAALQPTAELEGNSGTRIIRLNLFVWKGQKKDGGEDMGTPVYVRSEPDSVYYFAYYAAENTMAINKPIMVRGHNRKTAVEITAYGQQPTPTPRANKISNANIFAVTLAKQSGTSQANLVSYMNADPSILRSPIDEPYHPENLRFASREEDPSIRVEGKIEYLNCVSIIFKGKDINDKGERAGSEQDIGSAHPISYDLVLYVAFVEPGPKDGPTTTIIPCDPQVDDVGQGGGGGGHNGRFHSPMRLYWTGEE